MLMSGNEQLLPNITSRDLLSIPLGPPLIYTASHVARPDDVGRLILMNSASANSFTIPTDLTVVSQGFQAFHPGTVFHVVMYGAGVTSFAAASGVTLLSETSHVDIAGQYMSAAAIWVRPNEWLLLGRLA